MNKIEKRILGKIDSALPWLMIIGASLFAAIIRVSMFPVISEDMDVCLLSWYEQIAENGLYEQVGNYNMVYQFLIWLMTKLPIPALYSYKILSCIFDYVLAAVCAWLIVTIDGENKPWNGIWTYIAVLLCPIVFINSGAWGQCDAIYCSFAVLGLIFLIKERYNCSLLFLGLSFAFKLQAAFILPIYLFVYFTRRKFSILRFLLIPLVMVVTALPLLFWGRSLSDMVLIYFEQTTTYHAMAANYPSLWTIVCEAFDPYHYRYLAIAALVFTVGVLAVVMVLWIRAEYHTNGINLLIMAFLLTYTCVLFLPSMHERYGFFYEMCAIVIAVLMPKTIPLCIGLILLSMNTYGVYLFKIPTVYPVLACINIALYLAYTFILKAELDKSKVDICPQP